MHCDPPIKELSQLDIHELSERLKKLPQSFWMQDSWRQERFKIHSQTESLVLRFPNGTSPLEYSTAPQWLVWAPLLMPLVTSLAELYQFREADFCSMILAKLPPGGLIDWHVDCHPVHEQSHRIHVPIWTNQDCRFAAGDNILQARVGFAFELNNLLPHKAENRGSEDRLHLITDLFDRSTFE